MTLPSLLQAYDALDPRKCVDAHLHSARLLEEDGTAPGEVLAHRLAAALIAGLNLLEEPERVLEPLVNSPLPPWPPRLDVLLSRLEKSEGIPLRQLLNEVWQSESSHETVLVKIWSEVLKLKTKLREESSKAEESESQSEEADDFLSTAFPSDDEEVPDFESLPEELQALVRREAFERIESAFAESELGVDAIGDLDGDDLGGDDLDGDDLDGDDLDGDDLDEDDEDDLDDARELDEGDELEAGLSDDKYLQVDDEFSDEKNPFDDEDDVFTEEEGVASVQADTALEVQPEPMGYSLNDELGHFDALGFVWESEKEAPTEDPSPRAKGQTPVLKPSEEMNRSLRERLKPPFTFYVERFRQKAEAERNEVMGSFPVVGCQNIHLEGFLHVFAELAAQQSPQPDDLKALTDKWAKESRLAPVLMLSAWVEGETLLNILGKDKTVVSIPVFRFVYFLQLERRRLETERAKGHLVSILPTPEVLRRLDELVQAYAFCLTGTAPQPPQIPTDEALSPWLKEALAPWRGRDVFDFSDLSSDAPPPSLKSRSEPRPREAVRQELLEKYVDFVHYVWIASQNVAVVRNDVRARVALLEREGLTLRRSVRRILSGQRTRRRAAEGLDAFQAELVSLCLELIAVGEHRGDEVMVRVREEATRQSLAPAVETGLQDMPREALAALEPFNSLALLRGLQSGHPAPLLEAVEPLLFQIAEVAKGKQQLKPQVRAHLEMLEEAGLSIGNEVEAIWAGQRNMRELTRHTDGFAAFLLHRILELIVQKPS